MTVDVQVGEGSVHRAESLGDLVGHQVAHELVD